MAREDLPVANITEASGGRGTAQPVVRAAGRGLPHGRTRRGRSEDPGVAEECTPGSRVYVTRFWFEGSSHTLPAKRRGGASWKRFQHTASARCPGTGRRRSRDDQAEMGVCAGGARRRPPLPSGSRLATRGEQAASCFHRSPKVKHDQAQTRPPASGGASLVTGRSATGANDPRDLVLREPIPGAEGPQLATQPQVKAPVAMDARVAARPGERTRVATEVAIALAVSWKPLMKSNVRPRRRMMTSRTRSVLGSGILDGDVAGRLIKKKSTCRRREQPTRFLTSMA